MIRRIDSCDVVAPPAAPITPAAPLGSGRALASPAPPPRSAESIAREEALWDGLETLAGQPEAVATSTRILRDGGEAWERRLELIASAERSIISPMYHVDGDPLGIEFVQALTARAREGVNVILNVDYVAEEIGNMLHCTAEQVTMLEDALAELEAAGGIIAWYGVLAENVSHVASGSHFKGIIVDGERAIVGGRNIAMQYFGDWFDFDVELSGPVVADIAELAFEQLGRSDPIIYRSEAAPPLTYEEYARRVERAQADVMRMQRRERVRLFNERQDGIVRDDPTFIVIGHDPTFEDGPNPITEAMVRLIDATEHSMRLSSVFFRAPAEIQEAVLRARARGVRVTILTTGEDEAREISALPYLNAEAAYGPLLAAGVDIEETDQTEHGKMYVFDDRIAAFGSYNIEQPADDRLVEQLIITRDPAMVGDIANIFDDMVETHATPYTGDRSRRSFWETLLRPLQTAAALFLGPFI
ncbi:MAG: phosphatidylserine/phosphatidylglycerophosphate/cardiolipin synthase family protein [Deltaproteobacteria bacterium]|nr:phosphatidylserine/phosphatidylglycerophosphate/cardiolipin synthase family protein [Deltaproteobacteria bacterium]